MAGLNSGMVRRGVLVTDFSPTGEFIEEYDGKKTASDLVLHLWEPLSLVFVLEVRLVCQFVRICLV